MVAEAFSLFEPTLADCIFLAFPVSPVEPVGVGPGEVKEHDGIAPVLCVERSPGARLEGSQSGKTFEHRLRDLKEAVGGFGLFVWGPCGGIAACQFGVTIRCTRVVSLDLLDEDRRQVEADLQILKPCHGLHHICVVLGCVQSYPRLLKNLCTGALGIARLVLVPQNRNGCFADRLCLGAHQQGPGEASDEAVSEARQRETRFLKNVNGWREALP